MSSPQHCLAMADEADRLATIVSYECDKVRLRDQAAAWRKMAGALNDPLAAAAPPRGAVIAVQAQEPVRMKRAVNVAGWLGRRWA